MSFSIVAAIATNNIIGEDNKLPWHIPEDIAHFYKLIDSKPVIMGRKTYDSIGGAIKNSTNIVLSHDGLRQLPGCIMAHSVAEILVLCQHETTEIMVIGGSSIYQQFLPLADKMYLTFIEGDVAGDAYFPNWQKDEWIVVDRRDSKFNSYSYSFVVLRRKRC